MSDNCPDEIELHRPFIDAVTIKCPDCGKQMKRVPEVIDCWFDSGAMPFAQHHYPFENKELFEAQFPADFISEAVDQTRGWFYSLLAISTLIFNKAPYKNVIVLGHVLDKDGNKMSKSKGNAVDPFESLETYGADAIRWYFYSNSAPWLPNRFDGKAVVEGQRRFMGTLWNTYAFFVLYANIDGFDPAAYTLEYEKLSVMDKWLLSRLATTVKGVDEKLASYEIPETCRLLDSFVDDMSNWYVRCSRERYWGKEMTQDKINAYLTLYTALVTLAKAAAPMVPFLSESIYRNLVCSVDKTAPVSVHLCDWPEVDSAWIDTTLEARMKAVLDITVLGRSARNAASIKNRQPIGRMYVKAEEELPSFFCDIIKDELNVKEVVFTDSVKDFTTYVFKPQLKTVGPKYGKFRNALSAVDGNAAMDELQASGVLKLALSSVTAELLEEDLLIEMVKKEGFEAASDMGITAVLDCNLTEELLEEGFVNELVSKIQTMRKDSGFEVTDRIKVGIAGNGKLEELARRNEAALLGAVLGVELVMGEVANAKSWDINGEKAVISVEKV